MYTRQKIRPDFKFKIATSLGVLEQNFFFLWVGICIEIVHTQFRDPRWKIMASGILESWVRYQKKAFSAKKVNFAAMLGPYFFI